MADDKNRQEAQMKGTGVYHSAGFRGYGAPGDCGACSGEVQVTYEGAFVEVKVATFNGHCRILMEVDQARRYFRDVHEQLGDP